jgi:ATP-dependent DNA helicase PIF1
MCVANLDMDDERPIVNGSQGVVTGFSGGMPRVLFTNGREMLMPKHSWASERHPSVSIKQVPLILAWAVTIHKAQGATLSYAEVDAGSGVFECGQTYVALSRVRSLEGLTLTSFNPSKIILDQKVIEFYEECRNPRKASAEESDGASVSLSDKPVGLEKWFSKVKLQG